NLLKTQTGCHRKNRQSNRQKPEITRQAHQSTVLRSLHLKGIAEAASEQATALQEVNNAVSTIDQGTRQNAAMVEETSAASSGMAQQARQLKGLLNEFTLA
ncbi:hypothetical protein GOB83_11245, partial [Acetobacter fabarum]|nr:hypothetical protein [Acetobacter fabarum]